MTTQSLAKGMHVLYTYNGAKFTATVLFTTKTKVTLFVHNLPIDDNFVTCECYFTEPFVKIAKVISEEKLDEMLSDKEIFQVAKNMAAITAKAYVKVKDPELGYMHGYIEKVTSKGVEVLGFSEESLNNKTTYRQLEHYYFPFHYKMEPAESLVDNPPMPLDNWTVKISHSNQLYNDGGVCAKHTFFYKGKKALVTLENPYGAGYFTETDFQINGQSAEEQLIKDSIESFKIVGGGDDQLYFAKSTGCIGQWLNQRHLISLSDKIKPF